MTGGFWNGRRVLVTGSTGFKGAWLTLWLQHLGAGGRGLALPPEHEDGAFRAIPVGGPAPAHCRHPRSPGGRRGVTRERPDAVPASRPGTGWAGDTPTQRGPTRSPILRGGVRTCSRAPRVERRRFGRMLVVTTDKVYRNESTGRAFTKDDPLGGDDPYSKARRRVRGSKSRAGGDASVRGRVWPSRRSEPETSSGRGSGGRAPHPRRDSRAHRRNPGAAAPGRSAPPLAARPRAALRLPRARRAPTRPRVAPRDGRRPTSGPRAGPGRRGRRGRLRPLRALGRWGLGIRSGGRPGHDAAALCLNSSRAAELLGWRPWLALSEDWAGPSNGIALNSPARSLREVTLGPRYRQVRGARGVTAVPRCRSCQVALNVAAARRPRRWGARQRPSLDAHPSVADERRLPS